MANSSAGGIDSMTRGGQTRGIPGAVNEAAAAARNDETTGGIALMPDSWLHRAAANSNSLNDRRRFSRREASSGRTCSKINSATSRRTRRYISNASSGINIEARRRKPGGGCRRAASINLMKSASKMPSWRWRRNPHESSAAPCRKCKRRPAKEAARRLNSIEEMIAVAAGHGSMPESPSPRRIINSTLW